jgi:hypothetical protein
VSDEEDESVVVVVREAREWLRRVLCSSFSLSLIRKARMEVACVRGGNFEVEEEGWRGEEGEGAEEEVKEGVEDVVEGGGSAMG